MTDTFDAVLAELQQPETLRLHMGEMTPYEVMIAQAAVRFAHSRLAAAHAAEVAERDARIERLFAANEQVMARAEAAERDTARLDWMDRALAERGRIEFTVRDSALPPNVRQVIDAAIATTEQAPERAGRE